MEFAKIVFGVLGAAMGFGLLYEALSAVYCVEYFTLGYGKLMIVRSDSPFWIGLQFSFLGWSWVGAALGCGMAVAGRIGGEIQLKPGFFIRPVMALFTFISLAAVVGGVMGFYGEKSGRYPLMTQWSGGFDQAKHAAYVALQWSHGGAYAAALVAGATVVAWTWRKRAVFTKMLGQKR
jgi:uncharacterized membrane protein (UPF0136 family)